MLERSINIVGRQNLSKPIKLFKNKNAFKITKMRSLVLSRLATTLKMWTKRSKSFNRDFNINNKAWLFNTQITKKRHLESKSSSKVILKRRVRFNQRLTATYVHFNQWRVKMDTWCNWLGCILVVFLIMDLAYKITEVVRSISNSFTSRDIVNDTV